MQRMAFRRGWYYHIARRPSRRWTKLSQDKDEALRLWYSVEHGNSGLFGELIDRYLKLLPTLSLSASTIREYRRQAEILREVFGHVRPDKIRPSHIGQYLDQHPHKVSANREIALMSIICGYGLRWDLMQINPCAGIKRHKEKRRTRYIDPAEFLALKRHAGRLAPALDLAYLTAARKADLLALTRDNVREDGIRYRPTKTPGVVITVVWSDWLRQTVGWLQEDAQGPYLMQTRTGSGYTSSGLDSVWRRLRDRAGVQDCHWHDIRGTALTDVERARGVEAAKVLAGHSSVTMTEAYVRTRGGLIVEPVR